MRDIAVTLAVFIGLGYTLKKPHMGILLWSWLGYMNPHRMCYGFAYNMPFAQITAITLIIALFFSNEIKKLPNDFLVFLLGFFIAWMGITTFFAFESDLARDQYIKIIKIMLPIFLTLLLINNKKRIHQLLWVIVISLGYFGVKGGVFTLLTGGGFRVYGPPSSFVEENNALAVASLMIIPLMIYLRTQLVKHWHKQVMLFCMFSIVISVLGSQSRGAFLAIAVVAGYFWMQSNNKLILAILLIVSVILIAGFLPESWYERMNTVMSYKEDDSAMGRINAWKLSLNVANHNLLGGGLNLWTKATYLAYLENFDPFKQEALVAHSIYFSVLAEHGWFGLFLFLLQFFLGWKYCGSLIRKCQNDVQKEWISDLAKMLKVGMLAYFAGGAFLSLSYFDLPWHFLSIVVILKQIYHNTNVLTDNDKNYLLIKDSKKHNSLNENKYIT
jgi:probable O-glycosylation ligase (exosortase A-associated)